MAKKQERVAAAMGDTLGDSPVRPTEPKSGGEETTPRRAAGAVPATGRTVSIGVGLKESELGELDRIAASYDVSRNFLMRWLLRLGIQRRQAGDLPEPPRRLP